MTLLIFYFLLFLPFLCQESVVLGRRSGEALLAVDLGYFGRKVFCKRAKIIMFLTTVGIFV